MIPSRTSVKPNSVPRAATAMSQAATSPEPPPRAAPCTRATTGFGELKTVKKRSAMACASRRFSSRVKAAMAFIHCRSPPAQKAGPRPPSTMTRMASRVPRSKRVLRSSVTMSPSKALRTSGRLSQTRATGPCGLQLQAFELQGPFPSPLLRPCPRRRRRRGTTGEVERLETVRGFMEAALRLRRATAERQFTTRSATPFRLDAAGRSGQSSSRRRSIAQPRAASPREASQRGKGVTKPRADGSFPHSTGPRAGAGARVV